MRRLFISVLTSLLLVLLLIGSAQGQANGGQANPGIASSVVTGPNPATCTPGQVNFVIGTGMYQCTATNTWTQVPLSSSSSGVTGTALFGDGSDSSVTFDGSTVILGITPSANTYTLVRDIYPSAMTVNNGVTIAVSGFKIFCSGTLTNNGTISANGIAASGGTGGAGISANTGTYPGTSGGGGNGVTNAAGNLGTASSNSFGGSGGNGGAATNGGGNGGTSTAPLAIKGSMHILPYAMTGIYVANANTAVAVAINYTAGSGGGSGGSDNASATSGSGGAGGHFVGIFAKTITNGSGTISANGGAGSAGVCTAGNAGGGGGGGGGVVVLIYNSLTLGTVTAAAGVHGAGCGTGSNGVDGSVGTIIKLNNNN